MGPWTRYKCGHKTHTDVPVPTAGESEVLGAGRTASDLPLSVRLFQCSGGYAAASYRRTPSFRCHLPGPSPVQGAWMTGGEEVSARCVVVQLRLSPVGSPGLRPICLPTWDAVPPGEGCPPLWPGTVRAWTWGAKGHPPPGQSRSLQSAHHPGPLRRRLGCWLHQSPGALRLGGAHPPGPWPLPPGGVLPGENQRHSCWREGCGVT